MTCIVGLIENGIVYIGGDSAATDDSSIQTIKGSKVFKIGEFLFGVSGNPRMSDILRYNFEIPYREENQDILEYMHQYFIPDLKECLAENGALIKQDEIPSSDAWVLIGYHGRLFILESGFHVSESSLDYNAVGCGMDVALGCLYGLGNLMNAEILLKIRPEDKIELALRASAQFNCHVRKPFTILSTAQQD
jgi:ATP-dependent protease HslVU (ClpYQ) peptidase subunit